ncbi:glucose-6-phosphatase 3-like [Dreissena polymorpha]|uniref:glucose-6-phosphatase n=1 Tax=Dreissena polymorpha TaxID=45954 RepID=A0A9D3YQG5_DREPO|nr:glucose-6-phosphatase 3-like [Dreissena polymorpha]XP_052252941.1 glucose-6-phosphatase 3-like [Dreissena polymorpha]XP_052252942.1 glucose-6-phosphatase 3-like [Dreissena polymorpha]XP_052252943.1 glucose-6-phosphatase 3-like [Dreissena polymorpha]XP_052252944.1 glucose-6-phosphatase 3-like [Dreissena polymorpha]KAH3705164.1 hypothetical protein DPMN_080229 [Dreissena polymorpha]
MDLLHEQGVVVIQFLQRQFEDYAGLMQTISHLGDPRNAFLIYFPLAFCLHKPTGVQVLWLASLSEWINALLKWVLHGERPYWWVREAGRYGDNETILQQFSVTCETGPGSPSGHAMVTASVLFCMVTALLNAWNPRKMFKLLMWTLFAVFMLTVNISRLFIATHFPQQVVLGTALGILLTVSLARFQLATVNYPVCFSSSFVILTSCVTLFYMFRWIGLDPQWSIAMATKHCERSDWIHLDTTPFNAVFRDAGAIIGLGVYQFVATKSKSSKLHLAVHNPLPFIIRLWHIVCGIFLCHLSENVKPGQNSEVFFYLCTCMKFGLLVFVVMLVTTVFSPEKLNTKSSADDRHAYVGNDKIE